MDRRTPFGMAGQQSFQQFPPMDPQAMQGQFQNMNQFNNQAFAYNQQVLNGQESKIRSLMNDYEGMRGDLNQLQHTPNMGAHRPYSRELDLMNLLLIGSMDNNKQRSGLEGMGGLLGGDYFQRQPTPAIQQQTQPMAMQQMRQPPGMGGMNGLGGPGMGGPGMGGMGMDQMMGMAGMPQMGGMGNPQMTMGGMGMPMGGMGMPMGGMGMPQQQGMQQPYYQDPYGGQNMQGSTSPPSFGGQTSSGIRQAGQLLVNGQVGVNVDQYNQMPQEYQTEKPSDRITMHISRQNQILEELTKNLLKQRESKVDNEKIELQRRIKELESLNSKDQVYNDLYDKDYEFPQHRRAHNPHMGYPRIKSMNYQPQQSRLQNPYVNPYGNPYMANPYTAPGPFNPYGFQPPRAQQQQQSKTEKLQMMLMLKKLVPKYNQLPTQKDEMKNTKKKGSKSRAVANEVINDDSFEESEPSQEEEDEESVEVVQKPRVMMARPLPKPDLYDPQTDVDKLAKLISQRAMFNLRVFFYAFAYVIWYKGSIKEYVIKKRELTLKDMSQWIGEFVQGTEEWIVRVTNKSITEIAKTPKMNLQIVSINNKVVKAKEQTTNGAKLMTIVKGIIDGIVDNSGEQDLSEEMVHLLGKITHNREFLPQGFFSKFEISRLNFTYHGALDQMNLNKAQMMMCLCVWVRVLVFRVYTKPWALVQGTQVTDQMKITSNAKTICSVIYELVMMFIRGQAAPQPNNQKLIPVDYQVKERKEPYLKIDGFEPSQEEQQKINDKIKGGSDEPLVFPLYSIADMASLFDNNRQWVNTMVALIDGWSVGIFKTVDDYYLEERQQKLKLNKEAKSQSVKAYQIKQPQVIQRSKARREMYQQLSTDIANLKVRIKEESEKAERQRLEWEQTERDREQQNIQQIHQQGYR